MKHALVVQHSALDAPGAIGRELAARGVELRHVRGYAGEAVPESIGDASALVVLGGPMSVDDALAHPFLAVERRLLASAVDARVPVLGVCLGAQLLSSVLGGRVARGAAREIGWHEVERVGGDPVLDALPQRFLPFHWHEDSIVLPPGAVLLARSSVTPVQAFRAGERAYGVQFHLEWDGAMIDTNVATFDDELARESIDRARLAEGTRAHLAEQERMAAALFGAWAATL